jgi:hypothetical protein
MAGFYRIGRIALAILSMAAMPAITDRASAYECYTYCNYAVYANQQIGSNVVFHNDLSEGNFVDAKIDGFAYTYAVASHNGTGFASVVDYWTPGYRGTTAGNEIYYDFVINGPVDDSDIPIFVPVFFLFSGYTRGEGDAAYYAGISYNVESNFGNITSGGIFSSNCITRPECYNPGNHILFKAGWFDVPVNVQLHLQMGAGAGVSSERGGPGDSAAALAFIDPVIRIAPSYASLYTIEGLPAGGSAVPEPTTWGLVLTGLAFAGHALRRRRSTSRHFARHR